MTVTAAYAKANLPELLKAVERGETVTISRYNKPIADLVPSKGASKPARVFGSGKGKVIIHDPHWAEPLSDEEYEDFLQGRY